MFLRAAKQGGMPAVFKRGPKRDSLLDLFKAWYQEIADFYIQLERIRDSGGSERQPFQTFSTRARVNSPSGGSLRRSTRRTEGVESIQSPRIDHANSGCQPSSALHLARADSIQANGPWPLPT